MRFVSLAKKNPGADAPSEAGVGLFAIVKNCTPPENFRALSRESNFTPMPISDLSGAVFGNIYTIASGGRLA